MSEKAIIICVMLVALVVIAIVFIRRAMRYRKALGASVPENEVMPLDNPQPEPAPEKPSAREVYLARFIRLKRGKFRSNKTIKIREEHYNLLRSVVHVIGRDEVPLVGYLDNVLNAHFEDHRGAMATLFDERTEEILNGKA